MRILKILIIILLLVSDANVVLAESKRTQARAKLSSRVISIPRGLEGRVEFWILIFTKYGKYHRVFHNRLHPEVVYSSLDFSEFENKLSGSSLMKAKLAEVDKETERIKVSLLSLASGAKPRNSFERMIEKSYKAIPGHGTHRYREGADPDNIRYQTGIKERFRDGLVRSGKYLSAIEHIFEGYGLPAELGRLPLVESSFDYTAYSAVGAAGIWQFMPATAKRYMAVGRSIDERRDPIIATRAAAQYLKNAFEDTGAWSLAVTSYNHGLSGIIKAMRTVGTTDIVKIINKYESKSFGFASSNFYAEFLAALIVEQNSAKYFPGLVRERPIEFEEIRLSKSTSLGSLVKYSGVSKEDICDLNLSLLDRVKEGRVSIPAGTLIKFPLGRAGNVVKRIAGSRIVASSTDFKSTTVHAPQQEIPAIQEVENQVPEVVELVNSSTVDSNTTIELGKEYQTAKSELPYSKKEYKKEYTVKKGDTIYGLSKKFSISSKVLMRKLKLSKASKLRPGMKFSY